MILYNTLTRQKEELKPLEDGKVKIYTCGLTVYSQPHIGNWVSYIYWDVLVRALQAEGYDVERTQNITDVGHLTSDDDSGEDKLEKGAKREGVTAWQVADKYIKIANEEAEMLGLLKPTHLPRATAYIDQQITFVKDLESKGFTYVIPGDGVYFDTNKLKDYGKLARLDIEGLKPGARVPIDGKRNITDFAVWKFSHKGEKRDMEWESPWGTGFPGWHLECSVLARELLGDQIDIHTGGVDHIPVHHTNEIAQTESVTGKQFSQIWVHNNFLKVDGQKMAKSLGNIYTLQDILDKGYSLDAFKLLILSKHYQTEGNFTWDILEAAQNRLNNWQAAADLRYQLAGHPELVSGSGNSHNEILKQVQNDILTALSDDLDTPKAIALIDQYFSKGAPSEGTLATIRDLLGIDLLASEDISEEQKKFIADRQAAREAKDWAKSDELRDKLKEQGIEVRDTDNSPIWSRI
ncbi:cysteine--tRNA ligase [Candidatus Saccharibacteria bacterium]|nr:cysteine--tRNA ligase [Candidatus Saccharibacteria bacterium]